LDTICKIHCLVIITRNLNMHLVDVTVAGSVKVVLESMVNPLLERLHLHDLEPEGPGPCTVVLTVVGSVKVVSERYSQYSFGKATPARP
jgi:hypothetical protein